VVFETNAVLAVAAVPGSVVLEDTTSELKLAAKSKLAVVTPDGGVPPPTSVIGTATADADTDSVIVVLTGDSAVTTSEKVGISDVDVYDNVNKAITDSQVNSGNGSNENSLNATEPSNPLVDQVADEAAAVSEGTVDVSALYTLPIGTEKLPPVGGGEPKIDVPKNYLSGSTPVINYTAEKDLSTGIVTIKLSGTVADTFVGSDSVVDFWYGGKKAEAKALGGEYAIVTIDGIFTEDAKKANTTLKNTNPAWLYYKGAATGTVILASEPENAPTSAPTLWLDATDADKSYNWKKPQRIERMPN
jgi:hypothetical protein